MHKNRNKQIFGRRFKKHRSWDLFFYLAQDISNDLRAFLKYNINSVPSTFIRNNKLNDFSGDNLKLWHETVKKMWWSFDQIAKDEPDNPYNIAWNKYWKEYGQYMSASDFTEEKDGHTYYKSDDRFIPPSKEEMMAYEDKIKEGLYLFAEYYRDLWD